MTTLSHNPITKLWVLTISLWHIAATVVFLLVGLQPLEHFGPFVMRGLLGAVRALVVGGHSSIVAFDVCVNGGIIIAMVAVERLCSLSEKCTTHDAALGRFDPQLY